MFPIHLDLSFLGLKTIYHFESIYFIIAIICGILIVRRNFRKARLDLSTDQTDQIVYTALLFGLLGTRLSHFLFWSIKETLRHPLMMVTPGVAGASIVGGLMFGITAAFVYAKIKKIDFYPLFATASPALLIAQSIGRIGCFLNGDAFGIPAPKGLGMRFARFGYTFPTFHKAANINSPAWSYSRYSGAEGITETKSGYLYPTQLYEIAANMLLLLAVFLVLRKVKNRNAAYKYVFYIHAGGYSLFRALLQFIREDRAQLLFGNVSILQFSLLLLALLCIIMSIKTIIQSRTARKA